MTVGFSTPQHLTRSQFDQLQPNSRDSTLTKQAKGFIDESGYVVTPISKWSSSVDTVTKGKTKAVYSLFTPTKNTNAIYRWKVDVVEGVDLVSKRLIGKSSLVKKRLSSYFTAIRSGQGALAKIVLASLKQQLKKEGVRVSFGVIHSNVPTELLGRVENLLIKVHKAENPKHVLNQRAGGGGASQRKPLTEKDVAVVHQVATKILAQQEIIKDNLPEGASFKRSKKRVVVNLTFELRQKRGVVYDIENIKNGKHYIGKTETFLPRRISQHVSAINTGKRAKKLHRDIKKNPQDFRLRVLYQAPSSQRHILEEVERLYIMAFGSHKPGLGYNDNKGTTLIKKMASVTSQKVQAIFKTLERSSSPR